MSRGLNKPIRINLSQARGQSDSSVGEKIDISGKYVRVMKASSAAAECEIGLIGDFTTTYFPMVEMAKITERQGFDGILIRNAAQPNEWLEVVITDGPEDFDYERPMNNNIQEILDDVKVVSGATPLNINATSTDALLTAVLNILQDRKNLRTGNTDLTNANYYRVTNATTTVVTSGANANGAIIRHIAVDIEGGGGGYIQIGSNVFWERLASAQNGPVMTMRDFRVPAGQQIILSCAAGQSIIAYIELL